MKYSRWTPSIRGIGRIASLICLASFSVARAEVTMPAIFGDHMVLQRDRPIPIWGKAEPGERVAVSIAEERGETTADSDGSWKVVLPPLKASSVGLELKIAAKSDILIRDVLVGDVWICSGQSNMELALKKASNAETAVPAATPANLRFFMVSRKSSLTAVPDCKGDWVLCSPETAAPFSAVGYFFGKEVLETQRVPVGLIGAYWGGTPAQAWTSLAALAGDSSLSHYATQVSETQANMPALMQQYREQTLPEWERASKAWEAEVAIAKQAGNPLPPPPLKKAPPDVSPKNPGSLFNGMIRPLTPYAIAGCIWYQGESNAKPDGRSVEYEHLFKTLITDWRAQWKQGDFPFLFVQLASYGREGEFPVIRNAQLKALSLPNTGMAVAIDVGEEKNIHPRNKLDVGHRLALAARRIAYGEKIVFSGPIYKAMSIQNGRAHLSFDHVGSGLVMGRPPTGSTTLEGFEVAGAEGGFVNAQASIADNEVIVWSEAIPAPTRVRYAWQPFPKADLYNKEGLPASPFITADSGN